MLRGGSVVPLMRHGMTRLEPMTGQELVEGCDFVLPVGYGPIGHSWQGLPYLKAPRFFGSFSLSGVTRDSAGVALANCVVDLFLNSEDTLVATTTSDGSGNYRFTLSGNSATYFVRAYKVGSPDVAGTSVNTLTAVYP
jgi:hypothetical protein